MWYNKAEDILQVHRGLGRCLYENKKLAKINARDLGADKAQFKSLLNVEAR